MFEEMNYSNTTLKIIHLEDLFKSIKKYEN